MRDHATTGEKDQPPKYKVKLSGDGAKMTRLTGFVILSFSLLNDEDAVMSSRGKIQNAHGKIGHNLLTFPLSQEIILLL